MLLMLCLAAGIDRRARAELDAGKADFRRYAESGQVMVNRAMHLGKWVLLG
jgi:hypothetical protein